MGEAKRKRDVLEACDGFAGFRNGIRRLAAERGEYAGIPMPLEGMRLVVEPSYPKAAELMSIGRQEEVDKPSDTKLRSHFWSTHRRSEILIWEEGGKIDWGAVPRPHHFMLDLETLSAADVWGVEQEANAVQLLGTLLRHRIFKQYLLTGMFVESSRRSGISYVFRRLKPTVALSSRTGKLKIIAVLCLHPIAYYEGSWAGAMCPTDDVVAHLMLMRGDEAMFWRRANQHPAYRPEAGL